MAQHGKSKPEGRQRGVKASSAKLHSALLKAGLTSQSQVAIKIQQQEKLAKLPRSMVSRVFRSESVDPLSIERVAKVLNVAAWELYLNTEENTADNMPTDSLEPISPQDHSASGVLKNSTQKNPHLTKWLLLMLLLMLGLGMWNSHSLIVDKPNMAVDFVATPASTPSAKPSVMVRFNHQQLLPLVDALHQALSPQLNLANVPLHQRQQLALSVDIARQYQADGVITLRSSQKDRYQRVELLLYMHGVESVLFDKVMSSIDFNQQRSFIVGRIINQIYRYIAGDIRQVALTTKRMEARDNYLAARLLIDQHDIKRDRDEINNLLRTAIELDPQLAEAYAAMCQSLQLQSWLKQEKTQLEQSRQYCQQAVTLNPTDSYIQSMNAELSVLTGETTQAIQQFQNILQEWPDNVDALNGVGRAYIEAYNRQLSNISEPMKKGATALKKAIQVEPNYWYHHEALGGLYFMQGQTALSLAHFKHSAEMSGNLVALTNVGVLSLCQGQLDQAQSLFEQVQSSAPYSHLGDEYLGLLAFYQHDFKRSLQMNNAALVKLGEQDDANIHHYWGYLGDAYRWLENTEKTVYAYQQALNALQQYKLRGVNGIWEEVAEMYYQLHLENVSNKNVLLTEQQRQRVATLLEADASLGVKIKLAQLLLLDGKKELATGLWQQASQSCLVYQTHPDFSVEI